MAIQLDGKLRDRLEAPVVVSEEEVKELALASNGAQRHLEDAGGAQLEAKRVIYVPGRLVNIMAK